VHLIILKNGTCLSVVVLDDLSATRFKKFLKNLKPEEELSCSDGRFHSVSEIDLEKTLAATEQNGEGI